MGIHFVASFNLQGREAKIAMSVRTHGIFLVFNALKVAKQHDHNVNESKILECL